jgi:hypothetical protein
VDKKDAVKRRTCETLAGVLSSKICSEQALKNKIFIGILAAAVIGVYGYYKVVLNNPEEKMARFYYAARALNEKDPAKARAVQEEMKPEWDACNKISSDTAKKAREDCFQAIYDKWTPRFQ